MRDCKELFHTLAKRRSALRDLWEIWQGGFLSMAIPGWTIWVNITLRLPD